MALVTEARAHERRPMTTRAVEGQFLLKANQRQYRFDRINDLSASGMGLHLPTPLAVDTHVTLTYNAEDWHVTIPGRVVWADKRGENLPHSADPRRYRHGIYFDQADSDDLHMFFLTVRRFIDDL